MVTWGDNDKDNFVKFQVGDTDKHRDRENKFLHLFWDEEPVPLMLVSTNKVEK